MEFLPREGTRLFFTRSAAEQGVRLQVLNAITNVENSRASVELAKTARDLAQKRVDAEGKKYELGIDTIFFLLTAQTDLTTAADAGLPSAQIDRLRLTSDRIHSIADSLREVAELPDPVGQIRESRVRPNGLEVHKVGVPLGVILFIYESRPNVTVDAAGICVKSGNAVILRGGKEAFHSNQALYGVLQMAATWYEEQLQEHPARAFAIDELSRRDLDAAGATAKAAE